MRGTSVRKRVVDSIIQQISKQSGYKDPMPAGYPISTAFEITAIRSASPGILGR